MPLISFTIIGCANDPDLYYCRDLVKQAEPVIAEQGHTVSLISDMMLEVDWLQRLEEFKQEGQSQFYKHKAHYVILRDGVYLGTIDELIEFVQAEYSHNLESVNYNTNGYVTSAFEETSRLLKSTGAVYLKFVLKADEKEPVPLEKIVIQLATDCPIACENFTKLCTGEMGSTTVNTKSVDLSYKNCPIHRIVPGGWFQCGDIVDGSGVNSVAAIGEDHKVQDESLSADFAVRGVVSFTSSGPHANGSQFFITLGPCPYMAGKYVSVGKVVQGFETLRVIEKEQTKNQKPTNIIMIESCGKEA